MGILPDKLNETGARSDGLIVIKPWFETARARDLLADCVAERPAIRSARLSDEIAGQMPYQYDCHDQRVKSLELIADVYCDAINQVSPHLMRAARFDIGPTEAIDIALAAAEDAAQQEALRDRLLAQGLPLGEVNRRAAARRAA